ncbi:MAG: NAD(+)/NADH kinase [Candidatus Ancillula sp.]|jgi:NAD+ kinase|nr:NAD(+)/NADH kinase [Candidatus Ancillula sp.]
MKSAYLECRQGIDGVAEEFASLIELFVQKMRAEGFEVDFELSADKTYDFGVSLGGDGTFLSVNEKFYGKNTPVLGVNFGKVGFLTDASREALLDVPKALASGAYTLEERSTLSVEMQLPDGTKIQDWALNEAALEKAGVSGERYGMMKTRLEVDSVPLSSYGCDGIIISTATGSTAHAFSAGGPVIWPDVECFEVVPVAAYALFTRPLILGSQCTLRLSVDEYASGFATLVCDGHRIYRLPVGSTIEVRKSETQLSFVRLSDMLFTNRLVKKFNLPVHSWQDEKATDTEVKDEE